MNNSFWSHCQNLFRRLRQSRPVSRPRRRQRTSWIVEGLEARAMLSSTPAMVADINPGVSSSSPTNSVAIGSTIYFSAYDSVHGQELWKSDGTAAGTTLVKDIFPGSTIDGYSSTPNSSNPASLTNVNGTLFFTANDGTHGAGLWKSDGTAAGTTMVADINPGSGSYPSDLTNVNGTLFFAAYDATDGEELWKSDGTAAGTTLVKDIFPGSTIYNGYYGYSNTPNSSNPGSLTNVNGTLFFMTNDGTHGAELWKSDGTAAGTTMVADINPGSGSYPSNLTNVNGTLFFAANDGVNGQELWKSDGTAAGTTLVKDIFTGTTTYYGYYGGSFTYPNNSSPGNLTNVNGTLFFTADEGTDGQELWKSDGTSAGTMMVADINPGGASSAPSQLTDMNGTLYFSANDGPDGPALWKSNGTAAGTVMVADINPESNGSLTCVNGTLFFSAYNVANGRELWKSDGTAAGTAMIADINPGSAASYPGNLTNANGTLFFTANDGVHGTELWALNTVPAPSLAVSGFPTTITAGVAGSITVVAKNADGTTNPGYTGTIHFTSTDPQAVLPADYTFTASDNGTHTFAAMLKTAGLQSITATDKQTASDNGIEQDILVKCAAASTLTVGGFPSTTTAGVAGNVTVTLKDLYGNIATGYLGTVHITSSDTKAVLPANYAFTAADAGKHIFSVTLKTAGIQSIKAVDTANSVLTGIEGGITVTPAAARQFLISAPSSVKAGVAFSLTLVVEDAYGNVVTGYTGKVHFTSSNNTALLPANYTFTAADNGTHTFTGLILNKKGNQKITITDSLNSSLTSTLAEKVS